LSGNDLAIDVGSDGVSIANRHHELDLRAERFIRGGPEVMLIHMRRVDPCSLELFRDDR
jgi:hypothetical protein